MVLQQCSYLFKFLILRQSRPSWTFCLITFFTHTIFPSAIIYILPLFFVLFLCCESSVFHCCCFNILNQNSVSFACGLIIVPAMSCYQNLPSVFSSVSVIDLFICQFNIFISCSSYCRYSTYIDSLMFNSIIIKQREKLQAIWNSKSP